MIVWCLDKSILLSLSLSLSLSCLWVLFVLWNFVRIIDDWAICDIDSNSKCWRFYRTWCLHNTSIINWLLEYELLILIWYPSLSIKKVCPIYMPIKNSLNYNLIIELLVEIIFYKTNEGSFDRIGHLLLKPLFQTSGRFNYRTSLLSIFLGIREWGIY